MHGTDGIELQRRMHEVDPELIVIIDDRVMPPSRPPFTALKNGAL